MRCISQLPFGRVKRTKWKRSLHDALISTDDVDDFVIIRVRALERKVQRAILSEALAAEDLPFLEWQLLFSIARFGSCHLAHVTQQTSIDPAHGSRAVAALERKGLITRHRDQTNRRRKLISLTPAGIAKFERIWPRAQCVMKSVTDELEGADFDELKRLLKLVNSAADTLSQDTPATVSVSHEQEKEELPA